MKSQEHRDTTITDPPENVNDETVNELLSNTLLHLKFQDRNDIYEEIHGVRNLAREETPELIEQSLCSMAAELDRIISSSASGEVEVVEGRKEEDYKHAYQKTRQLEKTYVNDRDFHLKFLRADLFDAKKAADRLVVHLDFLLMLFGPRALEERLQASFFNTKEEAAALRSGNVQILPFRDRSGRRIMVNLSGVFAYSPYLRVKLWFYFTSIAAEDVETQRNGLITIAFCPSNADFGTNMKIRMPGSQNRIVSPNGREMVYGISVRMTAYHFCFPDTPIFRLLRAFYVFVLGDKQRGRMVFHCGTKTEMQYSLMGYGIPVEHIPATETGAVKTKYHFQWLRLRKLIETDPSTHANVCESPGINDVLFRRAGVCTAHPGNVMFKCLLESRKVEHSISTQTEKRDVVWSIVEYVGSRGGSFYAWDAKQCWWTKMEDKSEIRRKVAVSIRDFNSRNTKTIQQPQCTKSDTLVFERQDGKKRKRKSINGLSRCVNIISKFEPIPL